MKKNNGYYGKYKTAFLDKNDYDVVFLGSSRAELHYDCRVFDSITGRNSFNLSMAGATPNVAFAALKIYLSRSKAPADLLYEVDYHMLKEKVEKIFNFGNYFPFLSNSKVRQEFSRIDPRMRHFYFNPYYSWPYTGLKNISTGLHGWLGLNNRYDTLYYKGFLHEDINSTHTAFRMKPEWHYVHPFNRAYIDSLVKICRDNNIRLSLVSSPVYMPDSGDVLNRRAILEQLSNIARGNTIRFFDLTGLNFINDRSYFIDKHHMKYKGAYVFTCTLGRVFKQ